jgi:hypothetical protein
MNPRKLLVLTGAVLALFAFIILFERRMPTTEERQRKGPLHWELPEDRVESVRLERQDSTLELKKSEGGAWRLVKPESYPADAFAAMDLARELANLKRAGGDTAGARPDDYGLKPPGVKATFVWTEESAPQKKKTRTVEFGIEIPGMDIAAARLAGTENVIFVPASVFSAVKKNVNDFKSREVFGGSASDVATIDIERGRGRLVLAKKGGSWWLQQPVADLADSGVAARLAEELVALRALDFVGSAEKESLATQGLAPPLFRVALVDGKGSRSSVDFGATRSDGNSVYARRETQVLTVSIVEELSKETTAFREAHLVTPDRSAVAGVEGQFGDEKFAFGRSGGAWTAAGKPIAGTAAEDLLSAILDLKSKSFVDESDAAKLKSQTPAASVRLTMTMAPEQWEFKLYAVRTEVQAAVARRPGGFVLPPESLTRLAEAFKKAAARQPTPVPSPALTPKKK